MRSTSSEKILQNNKISVRKTVNVVLRDESSVSTETKSDSEITVYCPFDDVVNGIKGIGDVCCNSLELTPDSSVIVDITSFIKPYFFLLLKKLFKDYQLKKLGILYTEPLHYKKSKSEDYSFSSGSKMVGEIPGFGYHEDTAKKKLLIIIMGFEGARFSEVHTSIESDLTIPINGFPSYVLDYKNVSIIMNKDMLVDANCSHNMEMASASDPFETLAILKGIHKQWHDSHIMTISPLGTKPMALGSCLFSLIQHDVRVVFPYPTRYEPLTSTQESGITWLYKIEKDITSSII